MGTLSYVSISLIVFDLTDVFFFSLFPMKKSLKDRKIEALFFLHQRFNQQREKLMQCDQYLCTAKVAAGFLWPPTAGNCRVSNRSSIISLKENENHEDSLSSKSRQSLPPWYPLRRVSIVNWYTLFQIVLFLVVECFYVFQSKYIIRLDLSPCLISRIIMQITRILLLSRKYRSNSCRQNINRRKKKKRNWNE